MRYLNAFFIIFAFSILMTAAFSQKNDSVLSESDEESAATTTPAATPTALPTTTPKPTVSSTTTPTTITQESPMLIFPGAKIVSQNNEETILEIEVDPGQVSSWYQAKLRELNVRALATSQNNTNGNFVAKIAGASEGVSYDIEIRKTADQTTVKIILR